MSQTFWHLTSVSNNSFIEDTVLVCVMLCSGNTIWFLAEWACLKLTGAPVVFPPIPSPKSGRQAKTPDLQYPLWAPGYLFYWGSIQVYLLCTRQRTKDLVKQGHRPCWSVLQVTGEVEARCGSVTISGTIMNAWLFFGLQLTLKNQKSADNTIRWVMSRFAKCSTLNSLYDGPVRLVLRRSKCAHWCCGVTLPWPHVVLWYSPHMTASLAVI